MLVSGGGFLRGGGGYPKTWVGMDMFIYDLGGWFSIYIFF